MAEPANNIENWRLTDPAPGSALDAIVPYSRRAFALIARSRAHPLLETDFLQIAGATSILKGLDYHHERFVERGTTLKDPMIDEEESLLHEAVAYVNRAGQFYYFAVSELVTSRIGRAATPRLDALMLFRHKHTAHRSIDKPRSEDVEPLRTGHALALSGLGGQLWHPRELGVAAVPTWACAYLGYQIHNAAVSVDLVIERDHTALMEELYGVLHGILGNPSEAAGASL